MKKFFILIFTFILISGCKIEKSIKINSNENINSQYKISDNILKTNSIEVSVINTGYNDSPEFLIYQGGGFNTHRSIYPSFYVKHPKGDFLFEAGLGTKIDTEFKNMSWFDQKLFSYNKYKPVIEQLKENNFNPDSIKHIIISHLHWDHASGLRDFPKTDVIASKEEYNFALGEKAQPPAFIKEQYLSKQSDFSYLKFTKHRFLGFREISDLYDDGSVIFVKLPGHTTGSLGMFLRLDSGKKLFFVGDTIWLAKQIKGQKGKNIIASSLVDYDLKTLNKSILHLHNLQEANPDLLIIPTHDSDTINRLSKFPFFEK